MRRLPSARVVIGGMVGEEREVRWIKLSTAILDHPVWSDAKLYRLFSYLLLTAKEEQRPPDRLRRVLFRGQERPLQAGEITVNYRHLAEFLDVSLGWISKAIKTLEMMEIVNANRGDRGTGFSIVTICNWDKYQIEMEPYGIFRERIVNATRTQRERNVNVLREREKERERDKTPPTPPVPSAILDRLMRVYEGCRHWTESSARQALRWAGDQAEDFIHFAEQTRASSSDPLTFMPRPVNLYRRWKEAGSPKNGTKPVNNPNQLWYVKIRDTDTGPVTEIIQVREADLEARLNELRKKHGSERVWVGRPVQSS